MTDFITVDDEFGTLLLKPTTRGGAIKWQRVLNDVVFFLHADRKTKDYLLAFKAGAIRFKLNEMSDRIELAGGLPLLPNEFEPLSDVHENIMVNWLYDVGFVGKERMLQAMTEAAAMKRYHPVKEYFEGLVWDGVDRVGLFLSHFKFCSITDVFAQRAIIAFMVGAINKIFRRGQNFMLVIDGVQGMGKSYLARWLCPLPSLFIEGAIHTEDKDTYKRLISNFMWEVGELEGTTRKADRAALKDFITRQEVTIRVPYGRHDITKPAAASLIGTINEDGAGFLNDPTGSRRFAVVKTIGIDRAYSTAVDRDQLWAQLYHEYFIGGKPWQLTDADNAAQAAINGEYEADSPVEQHLIRMYEWAAESDNFVSSIEIMETLKLDGLTGIDRANLMEISTVLKREGLRKARVGGQTGFFGIKKKGQRY